MIYSVHKPETLHADILLPASKSISNRALILRALSNSMHDIHNLSDCDDTEVMLQAFAHPTEVIDIKAAGTAMRFLTAYFSTLPGERIITGTERMRNRPVALLVDALRKLGADIGYVEKEGFPPLKIKGKTLEGGEISLSGEVSSQYISALMMIAPVMRKGLSIRLEGNIISKPYIRMTQQLMEVFGVKVSWADHTITIPPQTYQGVPFKVENDWSAASYWYEMMAFAGEEAEITLDGLYKKSLQGDSKVAQLFEVLGVTTKYTEKGVILKKTDRIVSPFIYNFQHEPDLAQTFVVTCALKNIPFQFTGLQSLKIKETDRILALQNEMKKLGFPIREANNSEISWAGNRCPVTHSPIETYEDHRMAMAFAPVSMILGEIEVNDPQVVNKSYPGFWKNIEQAGFTIHKK